MPQKSLSLLERKRLQWEKEKEELIGLCSPWGGPPSLKLSTSCTSLSEAIKNISTNLGKHEIAIKKKMSSPAVVSSSYLKDLGLLVNSQSEYHLPPIGLEKQKSHDSDGFRDLGSNNINTGNGDIEYWLNRKRSLPSCSLTPTRDVASIQSRNFGQQELWYRNNGTLYHAMEQDLTLRKDDKGRRHLHYRDEAEFSEKWKSFQLQRHNDEDPHTSGYQSENNTFHSDDSGDSRSNGTGESDNDPKRQRGYFSTSNNLLGDANKFVQPQEAYIYTGEVDCNSNGNSGWSKPGSYLYSKRNEMNHYEVQQRSEVSGNYITTKSTEAETLRQKTWSYVNSRVHIPPPAMRSSFTTSLDAPDKDAYQDIKKQEHDKWLRDLELQREEQRLRKQLEKDEKYGRAKWGDRGVVVGHLWEPASVPDARLPPTEDRDGNFAGSNVASAGDIKETYPPRWTEVAYSEQMAQGDGANSERRYFSEAARTDFLEQANGAEENQLSEREQKIQKALQHQETIRKQIEERQQKLKEAQEKRIEEEKAEEAKILAYRIEELRRLEFVQRQELIKEQEQEPQNESGVEMHLEKTRSNLFASKSRADIDAFHRQLEIENSYLMRKNLATTFTLPPINPLEFESPATAASSPYRRRSISPFEEYEATVLKDDVVPALQRKRNLSYSSGSEMPQKQEFGTQTEVDQASFQKAPEILNMEHNDTPVASAQAQETIDTDSGGKNVLKKKKERPKWGIPQPTKQYLKQSEKDPHYQHRLQRRMERQKRRQNQLKIKSAMLEEKRVSNSAKIKNVRSESSANENSTNLDLKERKINKNSTSKNQSEKLESTFEGELNTPRNKKGKPAVIRESLSPVAAEVLGPIPRDLLINEVEMLRSDKIEQEEVAEFVAMESAVGFEAQDFRSDSPPVPALLKRMEQSLHIGRSNTVKDVNELENQNNQDSITHDNENVSGHEQNKKAVSSSRNVENAGTPKISPATLVIESSADYFSSPEYFSRENSNSGDISRHSDVIPVSPPPQLKQLIYGIKNLGNHLPVTHHHDTSSEAQNLTSELTRGSLRNRTIEFTIKFPAEYYHNSNAQGDDAAEADLLKETYSNSNADIEGYFDPYLDGKSRSMNDWLSKSGSREESALSSLIAIRKGIRNQQEEWGMVPSDSELDGSLYASSFYPSSERSSSSN